MNTKVDKIIQKMNEEQNKIKSPRIFSNLKKWRSEHGLTTPEAEAYTRTLREETSILFLIGYFLGAIVTKAFGG